MASLGGQGAGSSVTGPPQSGDAGGSARRRRQQRQRAEGRHLQWVMGLCQASASHHTGEGPRLAKFLESIEARLAALEAAAVHFRIDDGDDDTLSQHTADPFESLPSQWQAPPCAREVGGEQAATSATTTASQADPPHAGGPCGPRVGGELAAGGVAEQPLGVSPPCSAATGELGEGGLDGEPPRDGDRGMPSGGSQCQPASAAPSHLPATAVGGYAADCGRGGGGPSPAPPEAGLVYTQALARLWGAEPPDRNFFYYRDPVTGELRDYGGTAAEWAEVEPTVVDSLHHHLFGVHLPLDRRDLGLFLGGYAAGGYRLGDARASCRWLACQQGRSVAEERGSSGRKS